MIFNQIDEYEKRGARIIRDLYGNIPILQELQIRDVISKKLKERVVKKRCFIRANEPWFWSVAEKWR